MKMLKPHVHLLRPQITLKTVPKKVEKTKISSFFEKYTFFIFAKGIWSWETKTSRQKTSKNAIKQLTEHVKATSRSTTTANSTYIEPKSKISDKMTQKGTFVRENHMKVWKYISMLENLGELHTQVNNINKLT